MSFQWRLLTSSFTFRVFSCQFADSSLKALADYPLKPGAYRPGGDPVRFILLSSMETYRTQQLINTQSFVAGKKKWIDDLWPASHSPMH